MQGNQPPYDSAEVAECSLGSTQTMSQQPPVFRKRAVTTRKIHCHFHMLGMSSRQNSRRGKRAVVGVTARIVEAAGHLTRA